MSPAAEGGSVRPTSVSPSVRARIAAGAVLLALAGLAVYAVFSGPTKVQLNSPAAAPSRSATPALEHEGAEREGANGGD